MREEGFLPRQRKAADMSGADVVIQSLHNLIVILSIILGFVVAGTIGYFVYASHMKLEP